MHNSGCGCLPICRPTLRTAAVAVLVRSLPVCTFVSYDLFYWAFRVFGCDKHTPITPLISLAPTDQTFSFACVYWLYTRLATPIFDSCYLLPASQPPNMFPRTHPHPQLTTMDITNPLSFTCHVVVHFAVFWHVVHSVLVCVFGVILCLFWGVSAKDIP